MPVLFEIFKCFLGSSLSSLAQATCTIFQFAGAGFRELIDPAPAMAANRCTTSASVISNCSPQPPTCSAIQPSPSNSPAAQAISVGVAECKLEYRRRMTQELYHSKLRFIALKQR